MKDTKCYAAGFPIFFLSGLLFFNQEVPQDSITSPPTMEKEVHQVTEHPSSKETVSQDFSINVTEIEEDLRLHFLIHNKSKEELVSGMYYSL